MTEEGSQNAPLEEVVGAIIRDVNHVELIRTAGKLTAAAVTHNDGSRTEIEFAVPIVADSVTEDGA